MNKIIKIMVVLVVVLSISSTNVNANAGELPIGTGYIEACKNDGVKFVNPGSKYNKTINNKTTKIRSLQLQSERETYTLKASKKGTLKVEFKMVSGGNTKNPLYVKIGNKSYKKISKNTTYNINVKKNQKIVIRVKNDFRHDNHYRFYQLNVRIK